MKKLLGVVVLAGSLIAAGCVTTAPPEPARTPTSAPLSAAKAAPPPVTPEQVTATNGHQIAQKLAAELDREGKEP